MHRFILHLLNASDAVLLAAYAPRGVCMPSKPSLTLGQGHQLATKAQLISDAPPPCRQAGQYEQLPGWSSELLAMTGMAQTDPSSW